MTFEVLVSSGPHGVVRRMFFERNVHVFQSFLI